MAKIGLKYSSAQPPVTTASTIIAVIVHILRRRAFRCSGLGGSSRTVSWSAAGCRCCGPRAGLVALDLVRAVLELDPVGRVESSPLGSSRFVSITVFLSESNGRSTEIDLIGLSDDRPGNFSAIGSSPSWGGCLTMELGVADGEFGQDVVNELIDVPRTKRQNNIPRRGGLHDGLDRLVPGGHLGRVRIAGGELRCQLTGD